MEYGAASSVSLDEEERAARSSSCLPVSSAFFTARATTACSSEVRVILRTGETTRRDRGDARLHQAVCGQNDAGAGSAQIRSPLTPECTSYPGRSLCVEPHSQPYQMPRSASNSLDLCRRTGPHSNGVVTYSLQHVRRQLGGFAKLHLESTRPHPQLQPQSGPKPAASVAHKAAKCVPLTRS